MAGLEVTAVHVDHGLRPGSGAEAEHVARTAARLGAAFRSVRVEVGRGPNLEARARAARAAGWLLGLLCLARLGLGTDHPTDLLAAVALGWG